MTAKKGGIGRHRGKSRASCMKPMALNPTHIAARDAAAVRREAELVMGLATGFASPPGTQPKAPVSIEEAETALERECRLKLDARRDARSFKEQLGRAAATSEQRLAGKRKAEAEVRLHAPQTLIHSPTTTHTHIHTRTYR